LGYLTIKAASSAVRGSAAISLVIADCLSASVASFAATLAASASSKAARSISRCAISSSVSGT
jgi:hypothetical protein